MDKEVYNILNSKMDININSIIKKYKKEYTEELKDFIYIENKKDLLKLKSKFIRYVTISGKLNYGGFLYKTEKINNNIIIYLISKDRKIWTVDFDHNYIFYINKKNDKRQIFDIFLKNYTN